LEPGETLRSGMAFSAMGLSEGRARREPAPGHNFVAGAGSAGVQTQQETSLAATLFVVMFHGSSGERERAPGRVRTGERP